MPFFLALLDLLSRRLKRWPTQRGGVTVARQGAFGARDLSGGRIAGGLLGVGLVLIAIVVVVYYVFGKVVPPGSFGVRQVTAGPRPGFSPVGLRPGLHFSVPFFVHVHLVPSTIQVLNFHRSGQLGSMLEVASVGASEAEKAGLEIRTSDGLSVVVDVSILTRFYSAPGESAPRESTPDSPEARDGQDGEKQDEGVPAHGGPADLFTRVGMEPADWDNQVRKVAADELRRSLGALEAGQFYEEPKDRVAALERAKVEMRKRLDPVGISVESVLLRRYTYKDDRFDEAIFNKNIQEQEQRLKNTGGELAEVKAELEQVAALWDAQVETLRIQGENQAQIIRSEAALYENEKKAQGDLAVARAQAEVDRMKANALASSQGAAVYVAREMAPLISSLRGGVISNIDPYDIEEWAKRLGVSAASTVGVGTDAAPRRPASGGASTNRGDSKPMGSDGSPATRAAVAAAPVISPPAGSAPQVSREPVEPPPSTPEVQP